MPTTAALTAAIIYVHFVHMGLARVMARNLDEQVVAALRRKAELHGRSLEQELRIALTTTAQLGAEKRVALARRISGLTPGAITQTDSADLIRRHRNTR